MAKAEKLSIRGGLFNIVLDYQVDGKQVVRHGVIASEYDDCYVLTTPGDITAIIYRAHIIEMWESQTEAKEVEKGEE